MKNAIIFDYGNGSMDLIINELERQKLLKVSTWIDNSRHFQNNCELARRKILRPPPNYDWCDLLNMNTIHHEYRGISCGMQKDQVENFYMFAIQAAREDVKSIANIKANKLYDADTSIYSLQNTYFMLTEFFTNLIMKDNVQFVYFNNIPHVGSDIVLYQVAKKLNIQVVIGIPLIIFPYQFTYTSDINNVGNDNEHPMINKPVPYLIQGKYDFKKSYTNNIISAKPSINDLLPLIHRNYFNITNGTPPHPLNRTATKSYIGDMPGLSHMLEAISIYIKNLNINYYQTMLQRNYVPDNIKFVFFPLHMQPEATTLAFGGMMYHDQASALETLSNFIPEDWYIVVKEHYAQGVYMRDESFYKRLIGMKKVIHVSQEISTYDLMKKSIFVSTITGTAGWETIIGGKAVLIFGNAWYRNLPGVFKYHQSLTLDEITNYNVNYDELESKISLLVSKLLNGSIDSYYRTKGEQFDIIKNSEIVAKSLGMLIEE